MEKKKDEVIIEHHPLPDAKPIQFVSSNPSDDPVATQVWSLSSMLLGLVIGVLLTIVIGGAFYVGTLQNQSLNPCVSSPR